MIYEGKVEIGCDWVVIDHYSCNF